MSTAMRLFIITLLLIGGLAAMAAPWALPEWKYRIPLQVHNRGEKPCENPVVALGDLPFTLLISEGKLAADGADLRLLDDKGNPLPVRAEGLTGDAGDARLLFALDAVPPHDRRLLWLYYGNPKAERGPSLEPTKIATGEKDVIVSIGAEESAQPPAPVKGATLDRWLKTHKLVAAETGKGEGFAPQTVSGDAGLSAIGSKVLAASGGARDTVSFTFDIADAGRYLCWVRYLTSLPGKPAQGALTLSLAYNDEAPVERIEQCDAAATCRWVPLVIDAPFRGKLRLTARGKSTFAALDAVVWTADLQYKPDCRDFQGRVWVRWRIDQPADYRYSGKVHNELDPYRPTFKLTGAVTPYGVQSDLDALPFKTDDDYFQAGQYSPWVLLLTSKAPQWHSVLFFPPKPGGKAFPDNMTVRLEFANRPSPDRIFHITPAEPVEKPNATLGVRMPTETTLAGLKQLETFAEWSQRRLAMVEDLHLSPPPHLTKLKVGTWVSLGTRLGGGMVSKEAADVAFRGLEAIGVNMPSVSGVDDALLGEMFRAHGMIGATWTAWAGSWYYTNENYSGQYNYKEGETPPQRWQRIFDDFYSKSAASAKKNAPNAFNSAPHINLGDEIGQATNAAEIAKTPQLLAYFRDWLKGRGLTPADFGAQAWDGVMPLDDRKGLAEEAGTPRVRLFYRTWQFVNDYTAEYYRIATTAVKKYMPQGQMYAVNYQAGLMQCGFIGNNNDLDKGPMDIFHLGRAGAFQGVMMEDWVPGWDAGIGRNCLGAEIMRAASRKGNLPLASYLVGGEAIRAEFYAFLMHGIKENGLYLYGPITNIGPAWGEIPRALRETAEVTREVKKFEDAIAAGAVRPRRAAMLIAVTSDTMQKNGLYFCVERQALYTALKHSYLPVDVICEQDIVEDDLLKNYDLLYVSDPQVRDDVQRKIAGWVKAGGKLWACVGAAGWNEYNQPSTVLNDVFGVGKRETRIQQGGLSWSTGPWGAAASKFNYRQVGTLKASSPLFDGDVELPAWGMKLDCAPTTAQVLGTYEDGMPAVLLNTYGKGQALLVGALVGEGYMRQHYPADKPCGKTGWAFELGTPARQLAGGLTGGIVRPVTLSLPGIYTSVMDSPQGTLVFLNNATLATEDKDFSNALKPTVTVRVPVAGRIKSVESARLGQVKFEMKGGEAIFTLPLPNADVILLRK